MRGDIGDGGLRGRALLGAVGQLCRAEGGRGMWVVSQVVAAVQRGQVQLRGAGGLTQRVTVLWLPNISLKQQAHRPGTPAAWAVKTSNKMEQAGKSLPSSK